MVFVHQLVEGEIVDFNFNDHCALHQIQPGTREMHKMSNSLLVSVAMEYFTRISMILCINKIHNFFMATSIFNKR